MPYLGEDAESPKAPALSLAEAISSKNPYLCLSGTGVATITAGTLDLLRQSTGLRIGENFACAESPYAKLTFLRSLNLSDNPIEEICSGGMPHGLVHLDLGGCELEMVPACIVSLHALKTINLGANRWVGGCVGHWLPFAHRLLESLQESWCDDIM